MMFERLTEGRSSMRLLAVLPILLFALAAVVVGGVMFVKIGADQHRREAELQSIQAGQVPAETLSVVRKYAYPQKNGAPHCYVVFHSTAAGATKEEIKNMTSQQFYDATKVGGNAVGYRFPEGYVIPASISTPAQDAAKAKWIFLGMGLLMGAIFFLYALRSMTRAANTVSPSLADAIRARMNQSSDL